VTDLTRLPAEAGDPVVDRISTLLGVGTLVIVGTVALGSLLVVAAGRSPIEQHGPPLDAGSIPADLAALRPEGWLWLGLVLTVVLPIARVGLAMLGFVRGHERRMTLVSLATLAVLGVSIAIALVTR
jgi:uncharacterized membrane protein